VGVLNLGQAAIFALGLTGCTVLAARAAVRGTMTVGDMVAVHSLLLQLAIPFNSIGYTYQEVRQGIVDMEFMLEMIATSSPFATAPPPASLSGRTGPAAVSGAMIARAGAAHGTGSDQRVSIDLSPPPTQEEEAGRAALTPALESTLRGDILDGWSKFVVGIT